MTSEERQPLLARADGDRTTRVWHKAHATLRASVQNAKQAIVSAWPTLQVLVLPHLLGLLLSVATPAEVDAMRSLSCVHYYSLNPDAGAEAKGLDATSCQAPAVEVHFNSLMTRITFSVVLANFAGMLLYGRTFSSKSRRWYAILGMLGCALARVPLLLLPLYQYPYRTPEALLSISPRTMLKVYWSCAILGGFSGANELVTLTVESLVVDTQSPEQRSRLFSQLQIAQLLGASIGPMLGSVAVRIVPGLANRCVGYTHCLKNKTLHSPQRGSHGHLLFNTASYWLAVFFALFGVLWLLFVVQFKSEPQQSTSMPDCELCRDRASQRKKMLMRNPPKYAWLGAFQRLIPVRLGPWRYDARVLQFTLSEIFTAMMNEGVVVLILVMGYVFHWGGNLIAIGLSVSNSLRLAMIVLGLPAMLSVVSKRLQKPADVQDLSKEQVDAVLAMSHSDVRRRPNCCPSYERTDEARLLSNVTPSQRTLVRLWRAQVDLIVARISYLINAVSWLMMAYGIEHHQEWVVLAGAALLTGGSSAQPMVRSTACTIADQIVDSERNAALPLKLRRPAEAEEEQELLPDGADSYLVIVSTVLLPCLLIGLITRNAVYGSTIETFPGAFFLVVAGFNIAVLLILGWMRSAPTFYLDVY
ncbi:hypothetical protein GLX27_001237 [Malassezia furfur]|uniref:Uncharacterized protein n=1 Tax=Malassezia furfur TaxID=55194 RepID=A0ABY8EM13_MALFU|nr:hypothetical protein CBS14141_001096 [Malassezia furfur]WFD46600.1 hypothetical protein GLX27_001237 [Malassezia furfur]